MRLPKQNYEGGIETGDHQALDCIYLCGSLGDPKTSLFCRCHSVLSVHARFLDLSVRYHRRLASFRVSSLCIPSGSSEAVARPPSVESFLYRISSAKWHLM